MLILSARPFIIHGPLGVVRNFIIKQLMTLNHGTTLLCRIYSNLAGYDNEGWYDSLVVSRITPVF